MFDVGKGVGVCGYVMMLRFPYNILTSKDDSVDGYWRGNNHKGKMRKKKKTFLAYIGPSGA